MRKIFAQARQQLGWQGMSGIVLLLIAGTFLNVSLNPLERDTALMRSRIEAARAKPSGGMKALGSGDRQQELAAFFDSLPEEKDVTDTLASVYAVAEKAGVELKQVEYRLDEKSAPRIEYTMSFPVRGEYSRIRAFLASVLAHNPAMALDQVSFQRDKIGDATLNANVRLTLFLKPSW